jgi:hypothetical protein
LMSGPEIWKVTSLPLMLVMVAFSF